MFLPPNFLNIAPKNEKRVKTLKKRDYFKDLTEDADRIGNDLALINAKDFWENTGEPYLVDTTTAIFFTRGKAYMQINMIEREIIAPSMVILMEGMVVRHLSRSDNSAIDVMIISNSLTASILSEANVTLQLRRLIYQDPVFKIAGHEIVPRAFYYLLKVLVRMKDNPYRVEAIKHMTLTLFCGFALSRNENGDKKGATRKDEIAQKFLMLVRDNYRTERSVAWYADTMCLSPKYLSQAVKDSTGKPALDWIDEFTIVESKALLKSTDLTVDQISTKLNFLSSSLFGKYFKRVTGLSPREYRLSLR